MTSRNIHRRFDISDTFVSSAVFDTPNQLDILNERFDPAILQRDLHRLSQSCEIRNGDDAIARTPVV
jgi:hypothetical protein